MGFSGKVRIIMLGILLFLLCPARAAAAETVPAETRSPEETVFLEEAEVFSAPWSLYFGLLHAHTDISDGVGAVEEAFSYASAVVGLDFFAVTDHSNSFDNSLSGGLAAEGSDLSREWAAGKAAAAAVTGEDFLGLFGFEMAWPEIRQLGHITTFNTPGWLSRDQEGFRDDPQALERYLAELRSLPESVSQFCHPGAQYGDFEAFGGWASEYDDAVQLLEVLGEGSIGAYIQALDGFWHLAPTASRNCHDARWDTELRTVVLAEDLTEESFFEAIRSRRVYATEDRDLHICYELDGQIMGSVLSRADSPELTVALYDPTDEAVGNLEVIAEGGVALVRETVAEPSAQLSLSLPGGFRWYFLKITQPDGDVAVTAPVWVEGYEDMGILDFACAEETPVQGRPAELTWTVYNREPVDFVLTSLELFREGERIFLEEEPGTVAGGETASFRFAWTNPLPGGADLRLVVRGKVLGQDRSYEEALTLRFRAGETAAGVLLRGSFPEELKTLLEEAGLEAVTFEDHLPLGGQLLILMPGETDPEPGFLEDVKQFLETGGSILIWSADPGDNNLLEGLGSGIRVSEPVEAGIAEDFCREEPLCAGLKEGQLYLHGDGRALEGGSPLVKTGEGKILLCREQTPFGGEILVSGCGLGAEESLVPPESHWQLPTANRTILQTLLGSRPQVLTEQAIARVREEEAGTLCRIRGYVTAGTTNPNARFPETLYLQDLSGGIAVTGSVLPQVQIGTALEILGILCFREGNPELEYVDHRLTGEPEYRFAPDTIPCSRAMKYEITGGTLVQVEGTVTDLTLTGNKKGVVRLEVKDFRGDTAIVEIGQTVGSGSDGENRLAKTVKKGRTVRVLGIVWINEEGETVLRVRDCDEVVYIPPRADPTNPKTADRRWIWHLQETGAVLPSLRDGPLPSRLTPCHLPQRGRHKGGRHF